VFDRHKGRSQKCGESYTRSVTSGLQTCACLNDESVDIVTTMSYSSYGGGPVTIDHENIVKVFVVSPGMLGRGHTLLEPQSPVWSISSSEWHPQLCVGSADGLCLTTNVLRSTRRSMAVVRILDPFFYVH